jgi:hypothetical protein
LPWRALKDISSTTIHWSTFYNIATQIYNTYRAPFEPPPAWYCAQIPTRRASGSVIYLSANEWLSILASGLVWRPGEYGLAIQQTRSRTWPLFWLQPFFLLSFSSSSFGVRSHPPSVSLLLLPRLNFFCYRLWRLVFLSFPCEKKRSILYEK